MVAVDITDIPYPDSSFDVIYCSHVLEHVPEDRKAMRQMHRLLRPGGWALIIVPIRGECTFEDTTVTSPEERKRLFGQCDHVRRYGPDVADRLREAGFRVTVYSKRIVTGKEDIRRFGLGGVILFCEKS